MVCDWLLCATVTVQPFTAVAVAAGFYFNFFSIFL